MASSAHSHSGVIEIASPNVTYADDSIVSTYEYRTTDVKFEESKDGTARLVATPTASKYRFKTSRKVPRTGIMIVGYVASCAGAVTQP